MSHYLPGEVYQSFDDANFHDTQQQYYQGQLPQVLVSTPEQPQSWNPSPGPHPVPQPPQSLQDTRDQMNSPATSMHAAQLSRINSITFSQQNNSYMFPPTYAPASLNPSIRDEPWSPLHTRNTEDRRMRFPSGQSNVNFSQHQYSRVGSDIGSSVQPSDSGYISYGTSQSALGNESELMAQSLPSEFLNGIGGINVQSEAGSVTAGSHVPSDQRSHVGSTRSRKPTSFPKNCDYTGCTETFKCNSEYKKHMCKHEKPHRCPVPDCKRIEGFTTKNDLDRHRKSVHRENVPSNSYKCAGNNCKDKEKVWPRLDNFKQHVKTMHRDEDTADVIDRSKLPTGKQSSFVDDESTVSHMGANLVLDGVDKSLPSYPAMASSSPVEPSVRQFQQDRSSIDLNSDAVKEERRKPRFLDETSFATQPAHHQEHHAQIRAPGLSSVKQTRIPFPSDISMDPPPRKHISRVSQSNVDHGLSNAPQTKAEQQRMARKRSVAAPPPTGPADFGRILSMLQQANSSAKQNNESDGIVLSKCEAMELEKLLKAAQAAPRQTDGARQRICPYPDCGQTTTRDCDMRKHRKRHEKPYGCTYPTCYKRFGAKSDWKRHENNQHFQPEAFRCVVETSPGVVCGDYSHRLERYKDHLTTHSITSLQITPDLIKRSKIGKNCLGTFWCGFCKAIVPLTTRRNAAWDERFDHIARHLEKDKKSIEAWVCVEQNRPKKELEEEQKRATRGVEGDKEIDDESESVGDDEDADNSLPQAWTTMPTIQEPPPPSSIPESSRKREASSDHIDYTDRRSEQKRRRLTCIARCCCSCLTGPYGPMNTSCIECAHEFCSSCSSDEITTDE